ncbi:UDP-N-acetylmuramoyl-tripeptide--D-alanyl-D-alanine ligase [Clostridium manihotivorum]|uniref:UDP-N-acetylmuramoyl-tripeptide--D-alanyl-D-alanine ligase n=1 Tax=Clostridium manihotivorum TaxID=2320868 RepID=A0A3R5X1J1_9CLOT|nr:UDP-N-acetylmuramoyl-tripeptide--D-alanyl-D-alanine ligase [Clostridium manihotivorum]QAA32030.1 UDP-N-acetylmuramoyl-tripeptide--D-alanyl-D-alanine ligase [Clostridium manihotivorum]
MLDLTLEEISIAINGHFIKRNKDEHFVKVSTDTRKIEKQSIFFALRGENFNGNNYIEEAVKKGASVCIVDEERAEFANLQCNIIKVLDSKKALQALAKYYRNKLGLKVVGITGSNGKTSTKDILAAILGEKYSVFKTKGNFNNDIGLPLMILELDRSIDIAVLEMGMSNLREIHLLADIARPDIALITNIGLSHIENLKSRENILKAKMEIVDYFNEENTLIVNGDDDLLKDVISEQYKIIKTGLDKYNDLIASNVTLFKDHSEFEVMGEDTKFNFSLPMLGKHSIQNCLLCLQVGKLLGISMKEMNDGLNNIEATSMRLEIIEEEKITIVNDCYNASPSSMKAAIDVVNNIAENRKVAILGTMRELGDESLKAHTETGLYAKENNIDLLLCCGQYSEGFKTGFEGENCIVFDSKEELINSLKDLIKEKDTVLVKASRGMKFEDIVSELRKIIL